MNRLNVFNLNSLDLKQQMLIVVTVDIQMLDDIQQSVHDTKVGSHCNFGLVPLVCKVLVIL